MSVLSIQNHGPLILSTNYWGSEMERAGKFYISLNAGAFRVLVPKNQEGLVIDMQTAKGCAVSRGPWPQARVTDAFEILFDDGTDHPFAFQLSVESFDRIPTAENTSSEWILSVWTQPRRGKPHKVFDRPCRYRVASKIPDLRPWDKR